jgi:hypothetical protein
MRSGIVGVCLLLCACATPYQGLSSVGGVDAQRISGDTYRIVARGNSFTDPATLQDYVLLKAAETALAAGATHFLVGPGQDRTVFGVAPVAPATFIATRRAITFIPAQSVTFVRPGQDVLVRILKVPPRVLPPVGAFDAREVEAAIGPRVRR